MTTMLNKHSFAFVQELIKKGKVVLDQRDDWSEHQPSTHQENEFSEAHGWDEYANWHLGVDDEASEHTKARYKFRSVISRRCIAAVCSLRKYAPGRTSTATSRTRPSGCAT